MKYVALLLTVVFVLTLSALGQNDAGRGSVYFGYSHVTGDIGKNGWNAAGSYNFAHNVAGEVDLGGYYGNENIFGIKVNNNIHTITFGPKFMFSTRDERLTPWAHFLLGWGRSSGSIPSIGGVSGRDLSDNAFTWFLGGGADLKFSDHWAGVGKLDLIRTNFFNNGDTHARIGAGIAYKF